MVVDSVLEKQDIESRRTAYQFVSWFEEQLSQLQQVAALKQLDNQPIPISRALSKPFWEEVFYLYHFVKRFFSSRHDLFIEPRLGGQNYDALITELVNHQHKIVHKVEITYAVDGHVARLQTRAYLERRFFSSFRFSKGQRRKRQYVLAKGSLASEEMVSDSVRRIHRNVLKKINKNYPKGYILLVGFDDGLLEHHGDIVKQVRPVEYQHDFKGIYLVGRGGQVSTLQGCSPRRLFKSF
ncbi:hypothetical protein Psal006b_02632 [Piscirickettsia salmonis]|uniref:Uncharacterized protein n=1 Tax=Piscirickettsia salmonis TaxID=1238 RepID=A0A1L6T9B9_PISSA|nr:hypothetical protein [Piscirickettsia salmonis]AKP73110.1 hypothetical protein PSLF89_1094 [Piscirickettsia salmonis LF-89 = ATCC VR-1361]ALB21768.1 hypothetical protein KU39_584 [Piscirickettsia salmonis]ALY01953.1 hypothetical protein AWE47_02945 [Piscirickettsia salmonis]AMA41462.1 hypothetical protein AWJ11_02930 [Piscirickettsia salmonis]AOS33950.1 hypothetical protein AVM72_00185 [Piscirickettsia salmonis]